MTQPLERILYAEDEPDIREIAILALEVVGGFTLKVCDSGQAAVDAVEAFQPQLLLLDVMMPGMDGPTALRTIRTRPGMENMPAIFMTAKVQPQEVAEYQAMGTTDVIAKPFDPMTLADTVQTIWQKHTP
jgi:CheY-like chemotaxis protein